MTTAVSASLVTNNARKRSHDETVHHERSIGDSAKHVKLLNPFHQRRMEHRLEWAARCARDGNERMMNFYLSQAEKDAIQSGLYGPVFMNLVLYVRNQLT